ncbi:hypothetical protein D7S78_12335 [Ralstonia pickettii]|nr:hypothetical protein [Ralstonia pickettii]MBA9850622.1 hypothetical protein [Ralstonia pickettii]MBA9877667.1 hypothetical protein [Ralstonia pickettii]MBA9882338.1 hypothetical protein [Ralstonia pickettii]MBA9887317.1 hypothetical protein [Ralstonia pickettii]
MYALYPSRRYLPVKVHAFIDFRRRKPACGLSHTALRPHSAAAADEAKKRQTFLAAITASDTFRGASA